MDSVFIGHLETRYRLPPSRMAERRRLDRILQAVLDESLERALERIGIAPEEELCIRRIQVLVRLPMNLTDPELTRAWSLALAEGVRDALDKGSSDSVARYANRRQALMDFAIGIAAADYRRAWAWRQLGFGDASGVGDGPRTLCLALIQEPTAIVPVLAALANLGGLQPLCERLEAESWVALAMAALEVAGVDAEQVMVPTASVEPDRWQEAQVRRMLATSQLSQALAPLIERAGPPRLALTALVLLASEPAVLRWQADDVRLVLALAAHELAALTPAPAHPALPTALHSSATQRSDTTALLSGPQELPAGALRQQGITQMGGLLFLINLLEALALPDALVADERFEQRSLRWVLHRLALYLLPVAESDPAALAFIGLGPEEPPPTQDQEPPTTEELEAVSGWAEQLSAALRERLDWPEVADAQLLDRVCRRRAQVVADPGWIEVRFALEEVSTAIRRAGLDLNPGFLPWLEAVVKFIYE
ncbi:hypothetical protein [Nitrococcus mobilis]|uniref:Uncharacterized protein n=1 Tax=Nitrococcus mobilis Nb-231 TaxID=314278 RepID=A4BR04_9GAMM|nr:hypothetical protein [Nitrococcus mobilis]EAR22004.1 hypothetical protein NB231_06436 [Nitrococcus mobilis Nb-231]